MIKRLPIFLLSLILVLCSLAGCQEQSCEEAVDAFFSAAKSYDHETVASLAETDEGDVFFWGLNDAQFSAYSESITHSPSFRLFYRFCAKKLSYQIKESHIDGDTAAITVECRYVDGHDAILSIYNETLNTMTLRQLEGKLDPNFDYYDETIVNRIAANDENFLTATLMVVCIREEDGWKIRCTEQITEAITACLFPLENKNSEAK